MSDITRATIVKLICSMCRRAYSAFGLTVGQWHKGCHSSPRGKLICEHEHTKRLGDGIGMFVCVQCGKKIDTAPMEP